MDEARLAANVAVVKRLYEEVWDKGNREVIAELCQDPEVIHRGMEKVASLKKALPDLRFDMERYVNEGPEFVIAYFTARGTHTGEFMNQKPTGKSIVMEGSNIYRVRNGKIVEGWGHLTTQDAMRIMMGG